VENLIYFGGNLIANVPLKELLKLQNYVWCLISSSSLFLTHSV